LKAKEPRDRSASVRARLLNLARDRGEDFQITLRNYLFERFLYRLSRSELRERFVLKGAMLLRLWADQPYRATVDLDLLSRGNPDPDSVARDIAAICRTGVPDDAVVFDASTISVEPIRAQEEYSGVRAMFGARLGRSASGCRWTSGSAMRSGRMPGKWRIPWHWEIHHR
jgi:hypothetical protein